MNRANLTEFHYIAPIDNVPSILERGLLSHNTVARLPHATVSDADVQALRSAKTVPPTGRALHSYVNMFFHARNSMMYVRQQQHQILSVVRIRTNVLDLPGALVTDRNAAAKCRFDPPERGLALLDTNLVFARRWDIGDSLEQKNRKQIRSAEVLVPDRVAPDFITGAYVSCAASEAWLRKLAPALPITVNADLFFR